MLKYLRVRKIIRFNLFSTGAGKKCNRKKKRLSKCGKILTISECR